MQDLTPMRVNIVSDPIFDDDLGRTLNGVVATLETAEWTMRKLFTELSYRHYKEKNWSAMLHTELRMRVQPKLSSDLADLFSADAECAKGMHRIDRTKIIQAFAKLERAVPINLDNIVYLWNVISVQNLAIHNLTPAYLVDVFDGDLGLKMLCPISDAGHNSLSFQG